MPIGIKGVRSRIGLWRFFSNKISYSLSILKGSKMVTLNIKSYLFRYIIYFSSKPSICFLSLSKSLVKIPHTITSSTLSYPCITQFRRFTIRLASEILISLSIFKTRLVASPIISSSLSIPHRKSLFDLYSLKSQLSPK